jgi:type IV pilus assembly protein PilB
MRGTQKKPLAESLVDQGLITSAQASQAQAEVAKTGGAIIKVLVRLGFIAPEDLVSFLSTHLSIPSVTLASYLIKPEVLEAVPEAIARKYQAIPVYKIGSTLTVAMVDPLNVRALDEIRVKCRSDVKPAVATEEGIYQAIERYYGTKGTISDIVKAIDQKGLPKEDRELAEDPPIVKLVNLLVMQAIKANASDIHIEPDKEELRVRIRVDGMLHEIDSPPKHLQSAVISRIKILSNMNIAERRAPQDGRFQVKMENREVDIRVSMIPTIYGEKAVLRLLDTGTVLLGLDEVGLTKDILKAYEGLIRRPNGIVLVTGPTGSGKTTTLYASLNAINSTEKNIVTIEDPVEYHLKLVQQMHVNPKAGLTFATGLRSILRQDPDVIMVGEIRDVETAEIAIQAALTGHLVFSTLHTNDSASAVTRLIDMQVEPFLISSSLEGVIAQRLVRVLCTKCREPYEPAQEVWESLGMGAPEEKRPRAKGPFYRAKGCRHCMNTGYHGRIAIFELLIPDQRIRQMIIEKVPSENIKRCAFSNGTMGLRAQGLAKVEEGVTTIDEVLRVTQAA